ncbi:hypothetical protein LCGC14_1377440 [marine sediment metagenome]|uniref:Type I restriction enzyme R protein N-terminal domain-containing protein n=1 Tax=marine sediment metagenome TaxID=412755 RepID=A0A0F9MIZ1_9ZZZZ
MPGQFNYELRHKYPHLIGEDSVIWQRFISKYPHRFSTVDYDVHVGRGVDTGPISDSNSKRYWAELTKKRIDIVGFKDNLITIIEVKKRATLFTLGQVLGYRFLYLRDNPEIPLVRSLIICSMIDQDDILVLDHYGLDFQVI